MAACSVACAVAVCGIHQQGQGMIRHQRRSTIHRILILLAGGIAFNTPEREMGPTVKAGHSYPLHGKAEKEWLEWSPRIQP